MLGRLWFKDDVDLVGVVIGLSEVKKLDFRRLGEGEGGIWASVSTVRSDSEGLALRWVELRVALGDLWLTKVLACVESDGGLAFELPCSGGFARPLSSTVLISLLYAKVSFLGRVVTSETLEPNDLPKLVATGSMDALGIPDTLGILFFGGSMLPR